jgi:hypothetical protein
MFELWNSRNIARENFETQIKSYDTAQSASDKHFVILSIIKYLDRRYKFNPSYKDDANKKAGALCGQKFLFGRRCSV